MDIRVLKILLYNLVIYRDNINHESKTYYKIVFLLRRIEYDVEPKDEILYFMAEKKLSLTVIETILHNSQIYNIKKIERALESWMG